MTNKRLQVYLVKGPIKSYREAIRAIEVHEPLENVTGFNLHIRGISNQSNRPSEATLIRELGARPALYTSTNGFYSSVKLQNSPQSSLVASLEMDNGESMICFLSECDIIAVNVNASQEPGMIHEVVPITGATAFPWIYFKDVPIQDSIS